MSDRQPTSLERLWRREELGGTARVGLSLERIVQSGVELADAEGLAAVSMKRVAERLGFTTMSLYRYVTSKDELLLHMQDTVWMPPEDLDTTTGGWRVGMARHARAQFDIMQRHPWLDDVRLIERVGTPSQLAWMELGLRVLKGTRLTEYQKTAILLLFSGYAGDQARLAAVADEAVRQGDFERPEQATEAFGELLRTVVTTERFPALSAAVAGGAFAPRDDPLYASFDFGLDLLLDGVDELMKRQSAGATIGADA
ncbi:MAG TPA: TetR/AcrR family transcriptional regulator [Thermoleophilia bacterium]|nr:TetR/AcrR family transcriptional regulator [Thermoleophilia bacterium]